MPSQEDYLDSLLKDMAKDGEMGEAEFSGDLENLDLESLDLGEADLGEDLMEASQSCRRILETWIWRAWISGKRIWERI